MLILDLFISQNKLTEESAKNIENELKNRDVLIDELLKNQNISNEEILQVRSVLFGLPVYKGDVKRDIELTKFLNTQQSKQMRAIPLSLKDGVLFVGIVDPEYANVLESLKFLFNDENIIYKVYLITNDEFKNFLGLSDNIFDKKDENVRTLADMTSNKSDILVKNESENKDLKEKVNNGDDKILDLTEVDAFIDDSIKNLPVPEIISIILRYSIDHNASDLHIENIGSSVRVRSRIDGVLETIVTLPIKINSMLVARIKILCLMKLDEKRKPQDGRFSTKLGDHTIDYRVSTFPSYYGEKVVIRILDSYHGVRPLASLGFSSYQLEEIRNALTKPYGIVLISGPTGSGKTTTLYSMLNEIDRDHRNVVSLEDPIEYNVPSMNQSQIFPDIGYTFASGLRSILRQDPDVIMVGEIRDKETAELAIQAALTGHLVFSTIHTNTSIGVITRLLDMGVAPYLIAPTLNLAIGQRLVRSIAPNCAKPMDMDPGKKAMVLEKFNGLNESFKSNLNLDRSFNEASGTKEFPSGLKGRMPVLEVLTVTDEIENLILKSASEQEILDVARKNNMLSLEEDAMLKCMDGKIPFAEMHEL